MEGAESQSDDSSDESESEDRSERCFYEGQEIDFGSTSVTHHSSVCDAELIFGNCRFDKESTKHRSGWLFPPPIIPFTIANLREYNKCMHLVKDKNCREKVLVDLAIYIGEGISEEVASAFHSFLVNLMAYEEAYGSDALYNTSMLMEGAREGPNYTTRLDKEKSVMCESMMERLSFKTPLLDNHVWLQAGIEENAIKIFDGGKFDIGMCYRSNDMFMWEPENPDILEYSRRPVIVDEEAVKEFETEIREFLKNPIFELLEEIDYKFLRKENAKRTKLPGANSIDAKSYDWQSKEIAGIEFEPAKEKGVGYVAFIPRELKEARAAVVHAADSALAVQWIDANIRQIVENDKRSNLRGSNETRRNKMKDLLGLRKDKQKNWSYCRDFEKEGLTKPRWVCRSIMTALEERFPTWEVFKGRSCFFDNGDVIIDEVRYTTERGHGLGMANALTTMMQLVIERCVINKTNIEPIGSLYCNDDAFLVFANESEIFQYKEYDERMCSDLGLRYKEKKTFRQFAGGVFCEVYVSDSHRHASDKRYFDLAARGIVLKAMNPSHARSLAISMSADVNEKFSDFCNRYWGPILYAGEQGSSTAFGGWSRHSMLGVDTTFAKVGANEKIDIQRIAAAKAYEKTKHMHHLWKKPVRSRLFTLLTPALREDMGVKQTHEPSTRGVGEQKEFRRAWNAFETKLKKEYAFHLKKYRNVIMVYEQAYDYLREKNPYVDYCPPLQQARAKMAGKRELLTQRPVVRKNPYSLGSLYEMVHYSELGMDFEYVNLNKQIEETNLRTTDMKLKDRRGGRRETTSFSRAYLIQQKYQVPEKFTHMYVTPQMKVVREYHNAWAMTYILDKRSDQWTFLYDPVKGEKRTAALEKKAEVYGWMLTPEEELQIGNIRADDRLTIRRYRKVLEKQPRRKYRRKLLAELISFLTEFPGYSRTQHSRNLATKESYHLHENNMMRMWKHAHQVARADKESRRENCAARLEEQDRERIAIESVDPYDAGADVESLSSGDEEMHDDLLEKLSFENVASSVFSQEKHWKVTSDNKNQEEWESIIGTMIDVRPDDEEKVEEDDELYDKESCMYESLFGIAEEEEPPEEDDNKNEEEEDLNYNALFGIEEQNGSESEEENDEEKSHSESGEEENIDQQETDHAFYTQLFEGGEEENDEREMFIGSEGSDGENPELEEGTLLNEDEARRENSILENTQEGGIARRATIASGMDWLEEPEPDGRPPTQTELEEAFVGRNSGLTRFQ